MAKEPETTSLPPCPVCGRPAAERYRPFCTPRCQEVDLGRWLSESYGVPKEEPEESPPPGEADTP